MRTERLPLSPRSPLSPRRKRVRRLCAGIAALSVATAAAIAGLGSTTAAVGAAVTTATPIQHVVVIFDENISYDHYFGTYPVATNTDGTTFTAAAGTPANDNLVSSNLLTTNPNTYNPSRLTSAQAVTCDQNHNYLPEQLAEDNGAMDKFVQNTSKDTCATTQGAFGAGAGGAPGLAMDYYDGNTVTGLWNYAQNYAMSDNSWDAGFGPSTPGALNLISGQTHGVTSVDAITGAKTATPDTYAVHAPDGSGVGTVINDPDPAFDDCSDNSHGAGAATPPTSLSNLASMSGQNIGDLLTTAKVTWGWFQGGFTPSVTAAASSTGLAQCGTTHTNIAGASSVDYSPHHSPFQYYASTSNPHHLAPTGAIGTTDQANHQYDLTAFDGTLASGALPAVSFLKAPEYQDGHAAYSDPLDEQTFLTTQINAIEQSPAWSSTAIVISYDDSDGWYDHVAPTIINGSTFAPAVTAGSPAVTTGDNSTICTSGPTAIGGYQDRCGPSQRLPLVVISPYAKVNYIDHAETDQVSVLKFIEDNWGTKPIGDSSLDQTVAPFGTGTSGTQPIASLAGMFDFSAPQQREVLLDPKTGAVAQIVDTTPTTGTTTSAPATTPATTITTPTTTTTTAEATDGLASTGAKVGGLIIAGVLFVGAGSGIWLAGRHRRKPAAREHV
jgi:phospholipase C